MSKNQSNASSGPSSPLMSLQSPWDKNDNVIWLASTLRLLRNIEKFKFPHKLEAEKKSHIVQLVTKSLTNSAGLVNPFVLNAEEMSPLEREFLIEHFLIFEGFQEARQQAAFVLDQTGETIALLNVNEHIQLQCTDSTGNLEKSWEKLSLIESELAKGLSFAFSPKFGFLTADPSHAGTGLVGSSYLHIPALIHSHTLLDHQEKIKGEGIVTSGLQGNPDELVGDILMIRNLYTLGINEETILASLRAAILHMVVAEKDERSRLKKEKNPAFKDHISRSIGLLKYSYQLEAPEALSAVSFIKLGLELGWVKGMSIRDVNALFFAIRRSHLSYIHNEKSLPEEIAILRAEYLRKKTEALAIDI